MFVFPWDSASSLRVFLPSPVRPMISSAVADNVGCSSGAGRVPGDCSLALKLAGRKLVSEEGRGERPVREEGADEQEGTTGSGSV